MPIAEPKNDAQDKKNASDADKAICKALTNCAPAYGFITLQIIGEDSDQSPRFVEAMEAASKELAGSTLPSLAGLPVKDAFEFRLTDPRKVIWSNHMFTPSITTLKIRAKPAFFQERLAGLSISGLGSRVANIRKDALVLRAFVAVGFQAFELWAKAKGIVEETKAELVGKIADTEAATAVSELAARAQELGKSLAWTSATGGPSVAENLRARRVDQSEGSAKLASMPSAAP